MTNGKHGDATERDKGQFWKDRINCQCGSGRTCEEIVKKWKDLKSQTKKKEQSRKKAMKVTGGGGPVNSLKNWEEKIETVIPNSVLDGVEGGQDIFQSNDERLKEICIDESESSTSISKEICKGTSDNMLEATVSPANIYLQGKGFRYKDVHHIDVVVKAWNFNALSEDWETYQLCSKTARTMARSFNALTKVAMIRFVALGITNIDERALLTKIHKKFAREEAVVVEERLHGKFIHFVSNRNVSLQIEMDITVLEAFCHFTYEKSKGSLVVCGLKGVRKTNTNQFTLTNPTIHSKDGRYGSKDKRDGGIQDFRDNHKCNGFCKFLNLSSIEKGSADIEKGSDEC